ncbi:hypothetical protein GCM10010172_66430 [Paractinoplanes ferrugineus]|uniref:Pyrrolo-quinoline quinone repeat domain-containing protein n=1 Tax=Paractinoplanes ferrugineus TaxID=113564 RepID=A0A919J1T0_9ACTN|nr:PQQ-binding-like beta-propeller repeat protein [Actinoplanes ferrugineus]GIE13196.1 hypothetical protein Afe05nite_50360 [Actinoplanes ferrugineus]
MAGPPPAAWGQDGYGPGNTRYNPAESVVNASSIGRLALRWTVRPALGRPGCGADPIAPRVVGDRIFLRDGGGVGAYQAATGKPLWRQTGFSQVSAGPLVAGGLVLVAGTKCGSSSDYDGTLIALDAATGARRWQRTGPWTLDAVVADASTVVVSGACATCDDARRGTVAYRLTDGKPLWTHRNESLAGPVSAGGLILLRRSTGSAETWASRITTGAPVWGTDQAITAYAAEPAVFYIGDGGGLCARSAVDGRTLWQVAKEAGDLATDGRRVYVASVQRVNTYDARTGRLVWSRALNAPAMPVRAGGLLYVTTGTGAVAVLSATDGRPVATKGLAIAPRQHVVVAGGRLLTTDQSAVRAYAP